MKRKKVLITGSSGFIYGNAIRQFIYNKAPYDFVGVDKIQDDRLVNNIYYTKSYQFYLADVCDKHIMNRIFQYEQPDIVIHASAMTHVCDSLKAPQSFIDNNITATQNIIDLCIKYNSLLLFQSTDEVLGSLSSTNDNAWDESAPLNPRNPYSASKAAAEFLIKAAHNAHRLNYIIVRSSNNYGPRQVDKLVPTTIKCILNDQKIPIFGKGDHIRSWTYVNDNNDGIIKLIDESDNIKNQIFHLDSNCELTNVEIVQEICNIMKKGWDLISFVEDPRKNAHDFRYAMSCEKIKSLGWKPKTKFKDGLSATVNWYLNNQYFLKI
jgi:dTDP-glucose 4,6-dehydratase